MLMAVLKGFSGATCSAERSLFACQLMQLCQ